MESSPQAAKICWLLVCCILFLCGLGAAQVSAAEPATNTSADQAAIQVVPEPKQVTVGSGRFVIKRGTTISGSASHRAEDATAVSMLQEEALRASQGKRKLKQVTAVGLPLRAIALARTGDRAVKALLARQHIVLPKTWGHEGYVVIAEPTRVVVAGASPEGTFYGVQTLRQLIRRSGGESYVPAVVIVDWPTMEWRGVHDDLSRGPVPTMDYEKEKIRTLAEYKINMFSLYMEHIFDYESNSVIAPKAGAISKDQMTELVAYAKKYYVTLVPEQQAFGHLHHALKYEMYSDMAERPHGHVLAPGQPRTYDFIKQLYAELVPLFPGPFFHIGGDETFELGLGQTHDAAQKEGLGKIYLEHLSKVAAIMKPYNKRLMFWGDIALHYPELLDILPKDVIAVAWAYDDRPNFDNQLKPFRDHGLNLFVSPGVNNWNVIWPNFDVGYVNIKNFVRDGQKYGAIGMLNTTWNDDGETLFGMTWPGLVFGAECSWGEGECSIEKFKAKYDWAFYRNEDHSFQNAIDSLDKTHDILRGAKFRQAQDDYDWIDPFAPSGADFYQRMLPLTHDIRISAEHALELLYSSRNKAQLHSDTVEPMIFAGMRLDELGMKVQMYSEANNYYWDAYQNPTEQRRVNSDLSEIVGINARLMDMRDQTTLLRAAYQDLWLKENRPYWLGNVLLRYDATALRIQNKIWEVGEARRQLRTTKQLPPPEQLGFYIKPAVAAPVPPPQPTGVK